MPDIGLFEAIHTARSLRRLKPDPVPEPLITQVLDAAIRAPSAGNAQNWAFVVVRDAELRRGLGTIYRKASDIAAAMYAARGRPSHLTEAQFRRLMSAGGHLWDHMGEAPVILLPCMHQPLVPPAEALSSEMRRTIRTSLPTRHGSVAPVSIRRCRTSSSRVARWVLEPRSPPTTCAARTKCARCSACRRT